MFKLICFLYLILGKYKSDKEINLKDQKHWIIFGIYLIYLIKYKNKIIFLLTGNKNIKKVITKAKMTNTFKCTKCNTSCVYVDVTRGKDIKEMFGCPCDACTDFYCR